MMSDVFGQIHAQMQQQAPPPSSSDVFAQIHSESQRKNQSDDTGVWAGVKRNTVGMVSGLYHAFTDPASDQEKQELLQKVKEENAQGGKVPETLATNPSRATLAYHRLIDAPADQLHQKSGDELAAAKDLMAKGDTWKGANMYASAATDRGLAAIPLFGPWLNSVAERYESGDKSGAATDVASAVLMSRAPSIAKAAGEGLGAAKAGLEKIAMTPEGTLKPGAQAVAQVAGAAVGGAPGALHGSPYAAIAGASAGYKLGPVVAEHLLNPPATYPGASLPSAEEFYQARAADLMRREAAQRVLDNRAAAAERAAARNAPEPSRIITADTQPPTINTVSEGRPATWTNERVMELARRGNRDAIAQATRRGLELPPNARYVAGGQDFR